MTTLLLVSVTVVWESVPFGHDHVTSSRCGNGLRKSVEGQGRVTYSHCDNGLRISVAGLDDGTSSQFDKGFWFSDVR